MRQGRSTAIDLHQPDANPIEPSVLMRPGPERRDPAAQMLRNTSAAFVPPKPKLFDITVRSAASRVSRSTG
jgi:hypothetical protein